MLIANQISRVDIGSRVQTGRRTMYAMMGAGAFGCFGVAPPLVAHLWKTCITKDALWPRSVPAVRERHNTA